MAEDEKAAAEVAARIGELLSQAAADEVRARMAIGALLDGRPRLLADVADRVGLGPRALRQCVEVHQRIPRAELEGYLSGPHVLPWSAIVVLGRVTSKARRAALVAKWTTEPGTVRALARAAKA